LTNKLINKVSFLQSKTDKCVFYCGTTIYAVYTDDSILAGPDKKEIEQIIKDLRKQNWISLRKEICKIF
jgi:hypothetical protein